MTPPRRFDELTPRGQARRLNLLAADICGLDYGFDQATCRLLTRSFNTFVRVDCPGRTTALRIGDRHQIHGDGVEDIEAEWLEALHEDRFTVPRNVAAVNGDRWVERGGHAVPEQRRCAMYTWVRGRSLIRDISDQEMFSAGQLMADLHEQAAGFTPTHIPPAVRADRVVYFGANLIPEYRTPYGALLVEAMERAQATVDGLWKDPPHRPHLIHGDFGPHNLLRFHGVLRAIDFQDLLYGFDVMDLAITFEYLRRKAMDSIPFLISGFESRRAWPDYPPELLEALYAARSLNLINLGLTLRRPGLEGFLEVHSRQVADWMRAPA